MTSGRTRADAAPPSSSPALPARPSRSASPAPGNPTTLIREQSHGPYERQSPKAVPFDVDGTLVDTNYLNAVTWWEAFGQAGRHYVPMAQIHRYFLRGRPDQQARARPG